MRLCSSREEQPADISLINRRFSPLLSQSMHSAHPHDPTAMKDSPLTGGHSISGNSIPPSRSLPVHTPHYSSRPACLHLFSAPWHVPPALSSPAGEGRMGARGCPRGFGGGGARASAKRPRGFRRFRPIRPSPESDTPRPTSPMAEGCGGSGIRHLVWPRGRERRPHLVSLHADARV